VARSAPVAGAGARLSFRDAGDRQVGISDGSRRPNGRSPSATCSGEGCGTASSHRYSPDPGLPVTIRPSIAPSGAARRPEAGPWSRF